MAYEIVSKEEFDQKVDTSAHRTIFTYWSPVTEFKPMNRRKLYTHHYLILITLLLISCAVKLIPDYDATLEDSIVSIAKEVDRFYGKLIYLPEEQRKYDSFGEDYLDTEVELRALMLQPKLLLLDEPSLGLSPNYVDVVFEKLSDINNQGISILLVEQNAYKALKVCHRGYVFDVGSIALEGDKDYLIRHEKIRSVYLGQS